MFKVLRFVYHSKLRAYCCKCRGKQYNSSELVKHMDNFLLYIISILCNKGLLIANFIISGYHNNEVTRGNTMV
jgi:hypothetical protein